MIRQSWSSMLLAMASGLVLAAAACSSGGHQQEETLAVSEVEEAEALGENAMEALTMEEDTQPNIGDALSETIMSDDDDFEVSDSVEQKEKVVSSRDLRGVAVELGQEVSYIVQEGDWLSKIAFNVYGDVNLWKQISNRNDLTDPNLIVPGQKLNLIVNNDNAKKFFESYNAVTWHKEDHLLRNGQDGIYDILVMSGDSLSKIAERLTGDLTNWKKIYEENKQQIVDPDIIFVGQRLTFSNQNLMTH